MTKARAVFLVFSLLLLAREGFGQRIAFYDALYLRDVLIHRDSTFSVNNETRELLKGYFGDVNDSRLELAIQKNVFLEPYFKTRGAASAESQKGIQGGISGLANIVGGLDVTNIADGAAKFLVKRTKQELAIAFFDRFKEVIADTNYRDLQTLFPATYTALSAIGDEIYMYDAYLQTLRESFEKDLRELSLHLPGIIQNHQAFFDLHPELAAMLKSGCYVAAALREREHPGDILTNYPTEYLTNLNWRGTIQTLQLVSESLRDTARASETNAYWVTAEQVRRLVDDSTTFRIYLGLLYQQSLHFRGDDSIRFAGTTLPELLYPIGQDYKRLYSSYRGYFIEVSSKANKLSVLLKNYRKANNDSLALEQYYSYINATMDLFESASDVGKLVSADIINAPAYTFFKNAKDSLNTYFGIARSASSIVWDIKRRSYASAIVNAVHVYSIVFKRPIELPTTSFTSEQRENTINTLAATKHVLPQMLKYGTFMATVVQAKNSDEVESAIEAFALPPGSARTKRESKFNVALNAYVGAYGGYEEISGLDIPRKINAYGLTAPIGISFGWGHQLLFWGTPSGWSTSFFLSLVDLGAIAAFRFNDDTTKQIPTVQLKDIVSPGLFLSVGIPSCPISWNLGVQMGPSLHRVTSAVNDFSNATYFRYSLSVCVDIPLLNFYNRARD